MIYWSHNREYLHCTYKRILQGFNTVWNYDPCINFQVIPHCMLAVKDLLCFIKKSFATQPESTCIQCYSWSSVQLLPHAMWWHHHCPIILVNIFCTMRYCRMNNYSGSLTLTKLAWNKLSGTDTCINWIFFFFFFWILQNNKYRSWKKYNCKQAASIPFAREGKFWQNILFAFFPFSELMHEDSYINLWQQRHYQKKSSKFISVHF